MVKSINELEGGLLLIVGEMQFDWWTRERGGNPGQNEMGVVIDKALLATITDEVREECAKIADYWAQGNWKAQSKDRSRFNIYDLQRAIENAGVGIAEDIRALKETPHE